MSAIQSHRAYIRHEIRHNGRINEIYESFTSDDPSRRGKADDERQAAEFQQDRDTNVSRKRQNGNILLKDAMKKYVEAIGPSLSGTTVQGYSKNNMTPMLS